MGKDQKEDWSYHKLRWSFDILHVSLVLYTHNTHTHTHTHARIAHDFLDHWIHGLQCLHCICDWLLHYWDLCAHMRVCVMSQDPLSTEMFTKCQQTCHFKKFWKKLVVFFNNPINQWYYFSFWQPSPSSLFLHVFFPKLLSVCLSLWFSNGVQLRPWPHVDSSPTRPQHLYRPGLSSSCWACVPEPQPLPRWLLEVCPGSQATTMSALR